MWPQKFQFCGVLLIKLLDKSTKTNSKIAKNIAHEENMYQWQL